MGALGGTAGMKEMLGAKGGDGWELVAIHDMAEGGVGFFFKRAVANVRTA
jgi:hypothetical protein